MGEDSAYLRRISCRGEGRYVATLTGDDGVEKDYEFTVAEGPVPVVQACEEFGKDVGAFGYSHLVSKAVSAFHDACRHPVGRPGWARQPRPAGEAP